MGPMAALDIQTLLLCFVSGDTHREGYAKDLLSEIGEKNVVAERIAIGPKSIEAMIAPYCDVYVALDVDLDDAYRRCST